MRVNITCKGFTANEKQTALIEKKFQKLEKFFSDDIVVNVTMGYKKKRQMMEAMITLKGVMFRAEYTDNDMIRWWTVCLRRLPDIRRRFRRIISRTERFSSTPFRRRRRRKSR